MYNNRERSSINDYSLMNTSVDIAKQEENLATGYLSLKDASINSTPNNNNNNNNNVIVNVQRNNDSVEKENNCILKEVFDNSQLSSSEKKSS